MTFEREKESDNKKTERHGMYVENPKEGWKTTMWARMECSSSAQTVLCVKRGQFRTIILNFLLSSPNIYLGSCLTIQLHVLLIIWRIWLSAKIGVKSSFLYFGHFHNYDVICWLEDRNCPTWHWDPRVGDLVIAWETSLGHWEGHQEYYDWYTCLWCGPHALNQ